MHDTKSVATLLATADDPTDLRMRLRGQIRRLVEHIICQPFTATMDGSEWRCICADVRFRSGAQRVLLVARNKRGDEQYENLGE